MVSAGPAFQPVRFRIAGDHATRKIGNETIVVPVRARVADLESIYTFNDAGGTIWALVDGERSVSDIARALAVEFDVSEESALADVRAFLATLEDEGLVEPLAG